MFNIGLAEFLRFTHAAQSLADKHLLFHLFFFTKPQRVSGRTIASVRAAAKDVQEVSVRPGAPVPPVPTLRLVAAIFIARAVLAPAHQNGDSFHVSVPFEHSQCRGRQLAAVLPFRAEREAPPNQSAPF